MIRPAQVRVYIACSLDGFIAGPGDDLSWLPGADPAASSPPEGPSPPADPGALGFDQFMANVGALLMGRRTYDVVAGFGGSWPYGGRPVLVSTRRPLQPVVPAVRSVVGPIAELIGEARAAAAGKDVYIDGGALIRQALDAGLIDHLIVTVVPVVLGEGVPLFAGASRRCPLEFTGHYRFGGGMVQLHARPVRL
jgi:dihydrofolate reductase